MTFNTKKKNNKQKISHNPTPQTSYEFRKIYSSNTDRTDLSQNQRAIRNVSKEVVIMLLPTIGLHLEVHGTAIISEKELQ